MIYSIFSVQDSNVLPKGESYLFKGLGMRSGSGLGLGLGLGSGLDLGLDLLKAPK